MSDTIQCPKCGFVFQPEDAYSHKIEDKIKAEYRQKYIEEREKLKEKLSKESEERFSIEIKDLQSQLSEKDKKLLETQNIELELRKKQREIEDIKARSGEEAKKIFEEQKAQLSIDLKKEIEDKYKLQEVDLTNQVQTLNSKLENSHKNELEILRQKRELEEKSNNLSLELERKLSDERNKIWASAHSKFSEEYKLKEAQKEKLIEDMRKEIESLQRKAELSSQQAQGEIQEIVLESILRNNFPADQILPVPKGMRGGDVIQQVYSRQGINCGSIIWESKRTKSWFSEWIQKLKEDQSQAKAVAAVIVSAIIPKEINRIGRIDNIWVCDFSSACGLAMALRFGMIEAAYIRASNQGKNEKMEMLYNYFASAEFREKIENIISVFNSMKDELQREKNVIQTQWAKREKQIERVFSSVSTLYGEMTGIIGNKAGQVPQLEMHIEEENGEDLFKISED